MRHLAVLSVLVLATACDDPHPAAPPSDLVVNGGDDEVWGLPGTRMPGTRDTVFVASAAPVIGAWRFVSDDDAVVTTGQASARPGMPQRYETPIALGAPGDATLRLLDEHGAEVDRIAVHVRAPETLRLNGICDDASGRKICVLGDEVRVLGGSGARQTIEYVAEGRVLGLAGTAEVTAGPAWIERVDGIDVLRLPGADAAYATTIRAGDATLTVHVSTVAPEDATLALQVRPARDDDDVVLAHAVIHDRDGAPVQAWPFVWTLDGARLDDRFGIPLVLLPVVGEELGVAVGGLAAAAPI